jgi:hypothetical protein
MPYTKTILCLANSRKPPSGRCIAGREMVQDGFGDWVRPVSERPTREISEEERRFENGRQPNVLDVLAIQMRVQVPTGHQQENHEIDAGYYWLRRGSVDWQELVGAVEHINGALWANNSSSYYGTNDRVDSGEAKGFTRSLYLIRPQALRIAIVVEGAQFNNPRRRVRARFQLSGHEYCVVVTDPIVEEQYFALPDNEYPVPDAAICMSLGELHTDGHGHTYAYKLAAAVITPQRAGR